MGDAGSDVTQPTFCGLKAPIPWPGSIALDIMVVAVARCSRHDCSLAEARTPAVVASATGQIDPGRSRWAETWAVLCLHRRGGRQTWKRDCWARSGADGCHCWMAPGGCSRYAAPRRSLWSRTPSCACAVSACASGAASRAVRSLCCASAMRAPASTMRRVWCTSRSEVMASMVRTRATSRCARVRRERSVDLPHEYPRSRSCCACLRGRERARGVGSATGWSASREGGAGRRRWLVDVCASSVEEALLEVMVSAGTVNERGNSRKRRQLLRRVPRPSNLSEG